MRILKKGLIWGLIVTGVTATAAYSNPIEGGSSVTVTNSWDAGFQLTVGRATSGNTLSITNGGAVFDGVGIVGELTGSDGNNVAVSGDGSSWTNVADLAIGNGGSSNVLLIEDGGVVYNANGVVGVEEGSANNSVTVGGTNSVWHNADTLMVGRKGDDNSLVIANGGTVNSSFGAIGFESPAVGNTVLVTGTGSIWNNSGDLLIGNGINSNNNLTIEDGGKVIVGRQLSIYDDLHLNDGGWLRIDGHADLINSGFHYNSGSTLEVTGSAWFDGVVDDRNTLIFQGENATWLGADLWHDLSIGGVGNDNSVIVSNNAHIGVRDAALKSSGNRMLVTGAGSSFTAVSNLYIGVTGSDNEVLVNDQATASAGSAYIGYEAATAGNRLVVDGAGASFKSETSVSVGFNGSDSNRFELVNGGSADLTAVRIGDTNAMYNLILVDGSNSTFSANELIVGLEQSSFNSFTVVNGGQASSGTTLIGGGTNANNNRAWVSGTNSYWDAGTLTIGGEGSGSNTLTIGSGAKVLTSTLLIGTNTTGNALNLNQGGWLTVASEMDAQVEGFNWASWSTLEVQGSITMPGYTNIIGTVTNVAGLHDGQNTLILSSGGIWSNANDVTVGATNSLNTLQLADGGSIASDYGFVGADSNSNLVEITGSGSIWSNAFDFIVGTNGSDNTVVIADQGKLSVLDDTLLGLEVGSTGNRIVVQGSGSSFFNGFGVVVVGGEGASNEVQILDGASVTSAGGVVGFDSDDNSVLIDGDGSEWGNASGLMIGRAGSSNTYTVSNGAKSLIGSSAYLGFESGSDGNAMTLSGSNSYASITLNLHVGHGGSGNELRILDGARVFNDIGLLGTDNGSDNNRALISGEESLWYNNHTFFAGNSGSSNAVVIQDGAILRDTTGYIGYHTNAVGNRVVVDNAEWLNDGGLFVGFNGSGNSLIITNGAEVTSGESRVGAEGFANNNQALVSGDGSVWNISRSLWIGNDSGTNNALTVENGGRIVIDENISVGTGDWFNVLDGGTVTVYGDTIFTAGFNIGDGGTFETFGGVSGLGGVLESGRTLRLAGTGASWDEPGDILLESGSELYIGAGASVSTPSNYLQQTSATLHFGFATNSSGGPLVGSVDVGQYADFADGANFFYSSDLDNISFDATYTNTLVASDTLVVGGQTNATTADLQEYLNLGGSLLASISLFVQDQDIRAIINRISVNDALNPTNEDLRSVIAEIEARALAGDPLANKQLGIINSMSAGQALTELTQFYTLGTPNYQHMDGVLLGLKQIEKRTSEMLMETLFAMPAGGYGPAVATGEWRGWVSAYGNNGTRDSGGGYSGFDVGTYGTVLGVDKSFNNMVVGLSGGLAGSSISQEDGDSSDASTAYGAAYATFSLKQVDWDLIGSYGSSSIESSSGTVFGSTAETDASTAVFYIAASEEQVYGQFTVTPLAGFQAALYSQAGYDEVSANAVGRSVDDYERWSYRSIFGATMSTAKPLRSFDFLMRFKANWEHEFNTDNDTLNYSLIGGTAPHYFTIQAPVEDVIDLGVELGALFNENLEFSVGLDGRFSRDYLGVSYNGRIQYTF